jgi:hypothetical protein
MRATSPLFKGDHGSPRGNVIDVHIQRLFGEDVMTGRDNVTGEQIDPERYVNVIASEKKLNRQLCENVARVFAAALQAVMLKKAGKMPNRYYVEGCVWDWGLRPRIGADIQASIDGIIPLDIRNALPPPVIRHHSNRTRIELGEIYKLAEAHSDTDVTVVTHGYHKRRTERIGAMVQKDGAHKMPLSVVTPRDVVRTRLSQSDTVQPSEQFLIDAIEAAEPTPGTKVGEWMMETAVLGPLNRISRGLELLLRRGDIDFDLEGWIAAKKRGNSK